MSYEESSSSSINVFTRQGWEDVKSFKSSVLRKYFAQSLLWKTENERMGESRIRLHRKLVSELGPVAHFGAYYNHYYHYWFNQRRMQFLRLYRTSQKSLMSELSGDTCVTLCNELQDDGCGRKLSCTKSKHLLDICRDWRSGLIRETKQACGYPVNY
jgi:hypothetical protein